jgi:hypothetical protein
LAGICEWLAQSEYDEQRPHIFHVDPILNTAEQGSVPMELCLKEDPHSGLRIALMC